MNGMDLVSMMLGWYDIENRVDSRTRSRLLVDHSMVTHYQYQPHRERKRLTNSPMSQNSTNKVSPLLLLLLLLELVLGSVKLCTEMSQPTVGMYKTVLSR